MSTKSTHSESHNCWEADGLKEQDDVEHTHSGNASLGNRRRDEYNTHGQESKEYPTWPNELHDQDAPKATNGKSRLGTREVFGPQGGVVSRAVFCYVVYEITRNGLTKSTIVS